MHCLSLLVCHSMYSCNVKCILTLSMHIFIKRRGALSTIFQVIASCWKRTLARVVNGMMSPRESYWLACILYTLWRVRAPLNRSLYPRVSEEQCHIKPKALSHGPSSRRRAEEVSMGTLHTTPPFTCIYLSVARNTFAKYEEKWCRCRSHVNLSKRHASDKHEYVFVCLFSTASACHWVGLCCLVMTSVFTCEDDRLDGRIWDSWQLHSLTPLVNL